MNFNRNDCILTTKTLTDVIMQDMKIIQTRIQFLQRSLIQLSFKPENTEIQIDRASLYTDLLKSLYCTEKLLDTNKRIRRQLA